MTVAPMQCPRCSGPFQIDSSSAGLQVGCPHCGQPIEIPPLEQWGIDATEPPATSQQPAAPPAPHEPPRGDEPPAPPTEAQGSNAPDTFDMSCPHCSGGFQVTSEMSGTQVACPHCEQGMQLPELPAPTPAPPETPTGYQAPQGLSQQEAAFMRFPAGNTPSNDAPAGQPSRPLTPSDASAMLPPGMPPSTPPVEGRSSGDTPAKSPSGEQPQPTQGSKSNKPLKAPQQPKSPSKPKSRTTEPAQGAAPNNDFAFPPGFEPKKDSGKQPENKETAKAKQQPEPSKSSQAAPSQTSSSEKSKPTDSPRKPKPKTSSTVDAMLPPGATPNAPAPTTDEKPEDNASPEQVAEETTKTADVSGEKTEHNDTQPSSKIDSMLPPGAAPSQTSASSQPASTGEKEPQAASQTEKPQDESRAKKKAAAVDHLLPPGASPAADKPESKQESEDSAEKEAAEQKPAAKRDSKLDSLLPPTAPETTSKDSNQTIGVPGDWEIKAGPTAPTDGSVLIPTDDGGYARVYEPRQTVGFGDDEVELRKLTPEEKAARRFRRNLIIWTLGTIVLSLAGWILANGGL